MQPSEMIEPNINEILTGLVEYAQHASWSQTEAAIAAAEKQIEARERERVEKLIAFYRPKVNGLALPCIKCGQKVYYDYGVKDEFWLEHVKKEWSPDVLCAPCLDELAGGIPSNVWQYIYYSGRSGTVAFVPVPLIEAALAELEAESE